MDPSDYQVAIPSYARRVMLASKTLPLLHKRGVDPARVTIFVADDREHDEYRAVLAPSLYGRMVTAAPGMGAVRNFINDYYADGQLVLQIDDDIEDVCRPGTGNTLDPVPDLHALFTRGFREMLDAGATLWGIYPVDNAFFMRGEAVTRELRYVVGALFGVLNAHAPHCRVSLDDKEDFERTLLHYLHAGSVVRLNDVTVKTKYYTAPGGMQVTRTEERITASAHLLAQRYPDLCRINDSKKSGLTELRLKDRREKAPA